MKKMTWSISAPTSTTPVAIVEVSGAATSSPFDVSAFNSEAQVASDQPSSGAATTSANDIVLGYVEGDYDFGFSTGSGFTLDTTFNATNDIIEHKSQSSAGSISATATSSDAWRGWGDLMVAFKPGSTTTTTTALQYYHPDHLSPRVTTDSSGNGGPRRALTHQLLRAGGASVIGQQGHYPFGESWYATGTTTKYQFTSYERDSESGNDYAQARYHINRLGRFSSPDLIAGDTSDPQSLNRYTYVRNVPTGLIDPTGMFTANPCGAYSDRHKSDSTKGTDASGGPNDDSDSGEEQDFLGSCPAGPWPDPGIGGGGGGMDLPPDRVGCIISYQQGFTSYDDLNSCLGIGGPGEQQAKGGQGGGGISPSKDQDKAINKVLSSAECLTFLTQLIKNAFALMNATSPTPPSNAVLQSQAQVTQPDHILGQLYNQIHGLTYDFTAGSSDVANISGTVVHINVANYKATADKPAVWIHESMHSNLAPGGGFTDLTLAAAAGNPVPSTLTGQAATNQASLNYQAAILQHCGKNQ